MIETFFVRHGRQKTGIAHLVSGFKNELHLKNKPEELCFCMPVQLHRKCLKMLGVGMIKNGYCWSCGRTLKLSVSEEWTNGINWFFACWYRLTKIKRWSKKYGLGMVKNGCDQSDQRTLKLSLSGTSSTKLKGDSIIFAWAWLKLADALRAFLYFLLFTFKLFNILRLFVQLYVFSIGNWFISSRYFNFTFCIFRFVDLMTILFGLAVL